MFIMFVCLHQKNKILKMFLHCKLHHILSLVELPLEEIGAVAGTKHNYKDSTGLT